MRVSRYNNIIIIDAIILHVYYIVGPEGPLFSGNSKENNGPSLDFGRHVQPLKDVSVSSKFEFLECFFFCTVFLYFSIS